MGERERGRWRNRGREAEEKHHFPPPPYPQDAQLSVKNIAYLHVYCKMAPHLIAAYYSDKVSLADVHAALSHYYRDRKAIDAEIRREMEFNHRDTLGDASMSLPKVGLASLVDVVND